MATTQHVPIPREHARTAVSIPIDTRIAHVWEGAARAPVCGVLRDVSRGGARLSMSRVVPPRTRLLLSIPTTGGELALTAEVVWTSLTPGLEPLFAAYGLRWVEFLSRPQLDMMLPAGH